MAKEKPESGRMWGGDIGKFLTKDWQKTTIAKGPVIIGQQHAAVCL